MAPQHDRPYCFSHDPERAADAAEARRMGGMRRRKEGTIAVAYDLLVVTDGVGLDNGIPRLRVLDLDRRRGHEPAQGRRSSRSAWLPWRAPILHHSPDPAAAAFPEEPQ